jgi:hypothetical protein
MTARRSLALGVALLMGACSGKKTIAQAGADAGGADAGRPVRTVVIDPFLATSAQNLILDPAFFADGRSQWVTFYPSQTSSAAANDTTANPRVRPRRLQAPVGAAVPAAFVGDRQGSPGSSRRILLADEFVGGPGPFNASVWVSYCDLNGVAQPFPSDPLAVQVTIAAAGYDPSVDSAAWDLPRTGSPLMIDGLTWVHFAGTLAGPLDSQGLFLVRLSGIGGAWNVAAPEVVPAALEDSAQFIVRTRTGVVGVPPQLDLPRLDFPQLNARAADGDVRLAWAEIKRARLQQTPPRPRVTRPSRRTPGQGQ